MIIVNVMHISVDDGGLTGTCACVCVFLYGPVPKGAPSDTSLCGLAVILLVNYLVHCLAYLTEEILKRNKSRYEQPMNNQRTHQKMKNITFGGHKMASKKGDTLT